MRILVLVAAVAIGVSLVPIAASASRGAPTPSIARDATRQVVHRKCGRKPECQFARVENKKRCLKTSTVTGCGGFLFFKTSQGVKYSCSRVYYWKINRNRRLVSDWVAPNFCRNNWGWLL